MKKLIALLLMFVMANLCSAQTASTSKLNGTRWKLVNPTVDYCEIQYIDNKVFWFKILKFNDSEITLLSMKGQTTTFKRAL